MDIPEVLETSYTMPLSLMDYKIGISKGAEVLYVTAYQIHKSSRVKESPLL